MNKLEVGQIFKNYKAVCEWLEIKPTTGTAKIAQIKEFERYCKYHKEGQKFIIDEVYTEPLDKVDNRGKDGNSKYYNDIEITLLYLLQQQKHKILTISNGKALEIMNMINKNFRVVKDNIEKSSEILDIPQESLYLFFNTYYSPLINIFRNNLNKMANKSLLCYDTPRIVVKLKANPILNELGEIALNRNGQTKISSKEIHEYATDDEKALIVACERIILEEMGFADTGKQGVLLSGQWKNYMAKVNKKLYEAGNIKYYYDVFKIICYKEGIDKVIKEYQYNNSKSVLNDLMIDKIKTSIDKKSLNHKISDTYHNDSDKIIKTVIDGKCSVDMKEEIKNYESCLIPNA